MHEKPLRVAYHSPSIIVLDRFFGVSRFCDFVVVLFLLFIRCLG